MQRLLDAHSMREAMAHLARAIAQTVPDRAPLRLVGVQRRGFYLAKQIAQTLKLPDDPGSLTINLYRDNLTELGPQAKLMDVSLPFEIHGAQLVIVDDVFFTGRTIHTAVNALLECGLPETIRLAVLVSREGFRKVPIAADFVGLRLDHTRPDEVVKVKTADIDGVDEVWLLKRSEITR
jgi:pyrimidine operon attenuation protein/uracil phosphoribosyltransferase